MSLPFQDIAWSQFDQGVDKLKGCASACCWRPVADWRWNPKFAAVEQAARLFERAGAVVAPMRPS